MDADTERVEVKAIHLLASEDEEVFGEIFARVDTVLGVWIVVSGAEHDGEGAFADRRELRRDGCLGNVAAVKEVARYQHQLTAIFPRSLERKEKRLAVTGALLFSLLSATLLFLGAENFGELLYHNSEVGGYIRPLAPLVPIMYMDSVVDAHLKGMGLQVYSMGVNIADAAISVLGVLLLLPLFGAKGYVYVIYVTEIFNFAFSLGKLRRVLTFSLPKRSLYRPLSAAALTLLLFALLLPEAVGTLALVLRFGLKGR